MKRMKKLLSLVVVLAMVFTMSLTAFADEGDAPAQNRYEVYQILTGTVADGELTEIAAGQNFAGTDVAAAAEAMAAASGTNAQKLAVILPYVDLESTPYTTANASGIDVPDGYYLVKEVDGILAGEDDAYTTFIVKVVDGSLTFSPKSAKPTIDKQVWDEVADAEAGAVQGWGESADHAINESFQFKLIATLPTDADLEDYNTYKLVFNDTMSAGVTFESIESVTCTNAKENAPIQYTCTATEGQAGGSFSVTINDLKQYATTLQGTVVTVIYNAHLNENAVVNTESVTAQENNQNKVNLDYSNNPNYTGEGANSPIGSTEYDWVFVLTYENDSTKLDASVPASKVPMAGVPFTLKDSTDTAIPMYLSNGVYYPVGNSNNTAVDYILSGEDGTFAIKGLDAGTYTLVENQNDVNEGYNLIDDLTIVIGATHIENNNTTSVNLTLSQTNDGQNTLENTKGAVLPTTGGMGTTLIYLIGAILVIGAGVILVSKKRAENR